LETLPSNQPGLPLKVLVVDDESSIRSFAGALLADLGYQAVLTDSGRAAVQLLLQDPDDIAAVLLDMTMPGMSPEETFRLMREIRPSLPVVILSGELESAVRQRFGPNTIAGYISKPDFDLELERALAKALTLPSAPSPHPFTLTRLAADEVDSMRQEYLAKCRRELPIITSLLATRDFAALQLMGHTLKGSGGCFGLSELTQLGSVLEECARGADEAGCGRQVQTLKTYLEMNSA
jgi:CheY-like chemotaxis protein/HPt (histidine-containing phosphotransfer) domain-containing protein